MKSRLQIDLLRHGACEGGAIYRGHTDSPLSTLGRQQMTRALVDGRWQRLVSSPLKRCAEPAQAYASAEGLPIELCDDLREVSFGNWDGLPLEQVWQQQRAAVLAFWQDPIANPPPGAEPLVAVQQRTLALIERLVAAGDERVLLVTHGGVIRVLLCHILGMPLTALQQLSVDYASLTRIELYPDQQQGWHSQLIFANRLPSLDLYD